MNSLLPAHFTEQEKKLANLYLAEVNRQCNPTPHNYKAKWLLTHIHSPIMRLAPERASNSVSHTSSAKSFIDWRIVLPNGTLLTDPANATMFAALTESCFLSRELPDTGVGNNAGLIDLCYKRITITRWMYMYEDIYRPATHAFSLLTTAAVLTVIRLAGEGGVPWILGYPASLLTHWYRTILRTDLPSYLAENPFQVSIDACIEISNWLEENQYYCQSFGSGEYYLDRKKISADLGWDVHTIKSHTRFSAFLRQFEPTVTTPLLMGRERRREYPSHKTLLLTEGRGLSLGTPAAAFSTAFTNLFRLRRYIPQYIPDTVSIDQRRILRLGAELSSEPTHTPWIPLKLALKYTNEALRWIHVYGHDLVTFYLSAAKELHVRGLLAVKPRGARRSERRDETVNSMSMPNSIAPLCIDGWQSKRFLNKSDPRKDFDAIRQAPGLNDALAVLIGATLVILGFTKPIRQGEVKDLRRNAVRFSKGNGYWLNQVVEKTLIEGVRASAERPIPMITATSLGLIDRLCMGMRDISGDNNDIPASQFLYWVPDRTLSESIRLGPMTPMRQNAYLDCFCDYLNVEPDEFGRRWYLRMHETRKSFLIIFFWCYRFSSLETARWMAGHRDAAHIFAYIEGNFPGNELPALEAEYSAMQLWDFEISGKKHDTENVDELYRFVCRHFKVSSLSLIPERDLLDWLELAYQEEQLKIEPYSVNNFGDFRDLKICFRVGRKNA